MLDPDHPIARLLKEDERYRVEAYIFVFESLKYAHETLGMGTEKPSDPPEPEEEEEAEDTDEPRERHLSGQQLCEAIRLFALEQYGLMAETVLDVWGIHSTDDFGEIVFNLIRIGQMRKTKDDCREDFSNVFDFKTGFRESYKIDLPKSP